MPRTCMGFGLDIMTTADTQPDTNSPPPTSAPTARNMPPESLEAAESEEMTSGAPFPNAKRVTPANDSDSPKVVAIFSKAGCKNPSAVDPRI